MLRGRRFFVCSLAALALAIVPQAFAARPLVTGIHQTGISLLPASDIDLVFSRFQKAGSGAARISLLWRVVAPNVPTNPTDPNDPAYHWTLIDQQVAIARAHGLRPMLSLSDAPAWAEAPNRPSNVRQGTWKPDPTKFGQFGLAAATHFRGLVDWEVWNEPNVGNFLSPQYDASGNMVSPDYYRPMLTAFAASVRTADPSANVVGGSLAPFGHGSGTTSSSPFRFMRKLLCMSTTNTPLPGCAPVPFDVWAHHPYTQGGPTKKAYNSNDASLGDMPRMNRLLRAAVRAGHVAHTHPVQFWVTEISYDSKPPDPLGVPLALHARWTAEALYRMWKAGITRVFWWQLHDSRMSDSYMQSGLYFCGRQTTADDAPCTELSPSFANDVRKPAFQAFRFPFVAYAANGHVSIWGRTPAGIPRRVTIQRRTRSGWRKVTTVGTTRFGVFQKRWRSSLARTSLRARIGTGEASRAFSLVRPKPYPIQFIFGCGGTLTCP